MTKKTTTTNTDWTASEKHRKGNDSVIAASGTDKNLPPVQFGKNSVGAGISTLRSVFPQYKELSEIRQEIAASPQMTAAFRSLTPSRQQEFLEFCCGNRGVQVLYDSYFKYVFDPDTQAEPLSRMISVLLERDVRILKILPNESHLGADYTLVIMDIIVETTDGSIVNVEVQKIGYNFPGERAACYNADLLLRQYQRVRKEFSENDNVEVPLGDSGKTNGIVSSGDGDKDESNDRINRIDHVDRIESDRVNKRRDSREEKEPRRQKFSYKYIHPVFTIVFMETSTKEFHKFQKDYIHRFTPTSDTGLELNLLQNYIFVPIDIFRKHLAALLSTAAGQPMTERDAWLAFLSSDDPRVILEILKQFPDLFRPLYDRICMMCSNTEEMMRMFSEELSILDRNTVMMMIEEQQETIEHQEKRIFQQEQELSQKEETISHQGKTILQQKETIAQQNQELERLRSELEKVRKG